MSNNKQQTAVDYIFSQLPAEYGTTRSAFDVYQQAKEMDKERLTDAYRDGKTNGMDISHPLSLTKEISADEWYNETYGGGEE